MSAVPVPEGVDAEADTTAGGHGPFSPPGKGQFELDLDMSLLDVLGWAFLAGFGWRVVDECVSRLLFKVGGMLAQSIERHEGMH